MSIGQSHEQLVDEQKIQLLEQELDESERLRRANWERALAAEGIINKIGSRYGLLPEQIVKWVDDLAAQRHYAIQDNTAHEKKYYLIRSDLTAVHVIERKDSSDVKKYFTFMSTVHRSQATVFSSLAEAETVLAEVKENYKDVVIVGFLK